VFDLAIIGGGVNGTGIARDAAGRGLSVLLLEQGDLASGTSSASTKLIHGGLRYLEHYAFRLVRESLAERDVVLRAAPHIIRPLRFVLPHHAGLRPWWLIRLGLFLYDHLGGRRILPPTRVVDLRRDPAGAPLRPEYARGFEYSDCWVDDARLVVPNARDEAARGADIRTRTRCLGARRADGVWRLTLEGGAEAGARVLVNAAGPCVSRVLADVVGDAGARRVRLVKGSHIVVPRLYAHDRCYILQNADGRVCFAIPYEREFTLIGTTDEYFHGDPAGVVSTPAEEAYLCGAVSAYLRRPVDPADIVRRYAGVRPLLDDGVSKAQDATRDYVLVCAGAGRACRRTAPRVECPGAGSSIGVRRQTHDVSPAGRGCAGEAGAVLPGDARRLDRAGSAAGWGFPVGRGRHGAGRPAAALSISVRSDSAAAGAGLRHAGHRDAGRCARRRRSRPVPRCRSDRAGVGLAGAHRMGPHRRGRVVAPEQAGIAGQ
jgi:glycerol-3-phosphate dehydrogenase